MVLICIAIANQGKIIIILRLQSNHKISISIITSPISQISQSGYPNRQFRRFKQMFIQGQSQSLLIAQASLLFYSHYYKHLKCRIVEKSTSIVLCSKLINNCIDTFFNINRDLQDFAVELYQGTVLVGVFEFLYEDLQRVIASEEHNSKRKKYIKFKKENDSCSLYFTIQAKDIINSDDFNNDSFLYEDFVRGIASKVYKKLQKKAINRIKKIQDSKLTDKRLSLLNQQQYKSSTVPTSPTPLAEQKHKKTTLTDNLFAVAGPIKSWTPMNVDQNCAYASQNNSRVMEFCRSWAGLQSIPKYDGKSYKQRKNQYKLMKMRERVKKIFRKQIQNKEKDLVIIPEIKMTKMNKDEVKLLSEGIVFPKRVKSQNFQQICIKLQGFLQKRQPNYEKYPNFSSQIFQGEIIQSTDDFVLSKKHIRREKKFSTKLIMSNSNSVYKPDKPTQTNYIEMNRKKFIKSVKHSKQSCINSQNANNNTKQQQQKSKLKQEDSTQAQTVKKQQKHRILNKATRSTKQNEDQTSNSNFKNAIKFR